MRCHRCGDENPQGSRFCVHCGTVPPGKGHAGPATREAEKVSTGAADGRASDPSLTEAHADAIAGLPAHAALLLIERGPNAGAQFVLQQDVVSVGRHSDNDIFLDDVTVSRRHAEFHRGGDSGFSVHDVGSLNGTYVNEEPIHVSALASGDRIQIGKYRLVYLAGTARSSPKSSPPARAPRPG